jgi:hypothetical protein
MNDGINIYVNELYGNFNVTENGLDIIMNLNNLSLNTSGLTGATGAQGQMGPTGSPGDNLWIQNDQNISYINGNVGIGKTPTSNALDVSGNANFTSITINNQSFLQMMPKIMNGFIRIFKNELLPNETIVKKIVLNNNVGFTQIPQIVITPYMDDYIPLATSIGNVSITQTSITFTISFTTIGYTTAKKDFYINYIMMGA